uniref:F5K24.10 protein n=1 Tax=Arabidopsis thaliana TaxID=3702 RepID=Q9ZPF7_ARATH|nr:contains similarity to retrovirus-related polyproteins [Arabidopsis thaliana]
MSNPQSSYSVRDVFEKDKLNGSNPLEHLEDLEKNKTFKISSSGIYVIEVNVTTSGFTPWELDTGCGAHICVNMHGVNNSITMEERQVDLRMANGARVSTLLKNCYYVHAINKNIISVSCLDMESFHFLIKNKCCSFDRNDMFYGSAPLENELYVLNQSMPIYNICTKRFNDGLLNSFDYESYETCASCLLYECHKSFSSQL